MQKLVQAIIVASGACVVLAGPGEAATVGADGGVTLWVSFDNSNTGPVDIDDTVTIVQSTTGASCTPTNTARVAAGAPNSPGQCPGGAASCTGREKLTGDIQRFAEYVWQSTEGATYIRRVYVADEGRSWDTADIQWNMNTSGSTGWVSGWDEVGRVIRLRSSARACIHDVLHHEFGHYFHRLPDRYARDADGYYLGSIDGGAPFAVDVEVGDPSSVMNGNFPHLFNDGTNASLTVDYQEPGESFSNDEVLTPGLLADGDPDNDGPDRAHHGFTEPFAQDDWATMPGEHVHLAGVHTEGSFPTPGGMPAVDIVFLDGNDPVPGTVLLLDRSGSMGVLTEGVPASQYVQEAGLYLYHSSLPDDMVGTYLYNASVEELFAYTQYDPANTLPMASFRPATGLTDIAGALKRGIDELVAEHGEGGVNGARVVLMSDGRQTTGLDLWDEVDRANSLGIQIDTFSFGDADATTMAQISTNTSGDNVEVSEREDAFELKLSMAHKFSGNRGYTPVHITKEILKPTSEVNRAEVYDGRFVVPPFSRNLAFYGFLSGGDASRYNIELIDPGGTVTLGTADSIAERGRFNGIKAVKPEPGEWKYRIVATRETEFVLPRAQPFELNAHVRNLELDARIWVEKFPQKPGVFKVLGQASFRYPLTGLRARALIYRSGAQRGAIELFDDGRQGGDMQAGDGVYTGLLEAREFGLDQPAAKDRPAKTRLDGHFIIGRSARPAPNAHYETGTSIDVIAKDYAANGQSELPFDAWATTTYDFIWDQQPDDRGLDLVEPPRRFKVRPGEEGKLVIRVRGVQPIKSQIRLSMGPGIRVQLADYRPLQRTLGAEMVLVYAVSRRAAEGPRDLRFQQGGANYSIAPAVYVVR